MIPYSTYRITMIDPERIHRINAEPEPVRRYDRATVINTVNVVYKRMAVAAAPVAQKLYNGQYINDREGEVYNGWAITDDGICALTGQEKVDVVSPLTVDLPSDKFTITYNNADTGEQYEAPGRVPVEYMIDHIDTEIAIARGQLVGVTNRNDRKKTLSQIDMRQDERRVLIDNSLPLALEQAELVRDAIHKEAYLVSSNTERTQRDDVKNHLKGEKIIKKERRGLIIPPAEPKEGNYIAPWDRLTWEDLEAAFPVEKRVRNPWITAGGTEPLSDYHKQWERFNWDDINASLGRTTDGLRFRGIFDYIKYSSREGYRLMAVGLGEFGEDLKYSVPEPLRRRVDLTRRRLSETEFKLPNVDRRLLALLGLTVLALVALKSCEKPAVAPVVGQKVKPEATAIPAPQHDYGTRGVFPNIKEEKAAAQQTIPEPILNQPDETSNPPFERKILTKGVIVEVGDDLKGLIEASLRRINPNKSSAFISALRMPLVWEIALKNGLNDPDLIRPGQLLKFPDDGTLKVLIENFDPEDSSTAEALKYFGSIQKTKEDKLAAGVSAEMWLQDALNVAGREE